MAKRLFIALFFFIPSTVLASISNDALLSKLRAIANGLDGKAGVGVLGLDFNDTLLLNDQLRLPMQSVYKFPLAITILSKVDKGELSLSQKVQINKANLEKDTWSPMLKDFKRDRFDMTLSDLLLYSVSKSDNNACDILFQFAGGTKAVDSYFKNQGIAGMAIAATEAEMHKDWNTQYTNWCFPSAMLQVLRAFYSGKLLNPSSNAFLMKLMIESENSPKRIMGALPDNTIVAHKTGTGNTSAEGRTAATNDVGIITLPDGRHYALVVYVSDYKGGIARGEKTIADISKAVWNHYTLNGTDNNVARLAPEASRTILHLFDSSRGRRIPVAIYQCASKQTRFKNLVIINHGYEPGSEDAFLGYSYIANHLCAKGYLVISIQQDLTTDPPIPREGNLQQLRLPFWECGLKNIRFVLADIAGRYPRYAFRKPILIGHSNGGDIAALYTSRYREETKALITLDNRRVALPRTRYPGICSFRSSDLPADEGVLPGPAEEKKHDMQIIHLPATKHGEMADNASAEQQAEILRYIDIFLEDSKRAR
jgi:beta-lactamase class A